jgi:PleD family two-component response regulator
MDLSARFGGEEFITVLNDCEIGPATAFANRVRTDVESRRFPWGQITVSAGVASYEEGMGSWEVLVAAADRALYSAKEAGRNRVMVAEQTEKTTLISFAARRPVADPMPPVAKGETVVVIDDDPHVLRAVARLLRRGGYQVEETDDPQTVIRRFGDASPPHLLVTDVMMPKMNGLTLAAKISTTHPALKVVYLSGYLQRDVSWAGLPGAITGFVAKPIEMQELLTMTRNVLDRGVIPTN